MAQPHSISELMHQASSLAGLTIGTIAERFGVTLPANLKQQKGWLGEFFEIVLGADQHNLPAPDFSALGVELKTLPIDNNGKPLESTFVCTIPLLEIKHETWASSTVWRKLQCVLWIPIISHEHTLAERIVATPLLWRPKPQEIATLAQDWQQLVDQIVLGDLAQITARQGVALQIRPKAANGRALCWAINEVGELFQTLPRGFYLRAKFTHQLLKDNFLI